MSTDKVRKAVVTKALKAAQANVWEANDGMSSAASARMQALADWAEVNGDNVAAAAEVMGIDRGRTHHLFVALRRWRAAGGQPSVEVGDCE